MNTLDRLRVVRPSSHGDNPTVRWRAASWTSLSPEAPGLYHHRTPGDPGLMRLAHVRRNSAGVMVARFATGEEPVADQSGEWAGPLTLTLDE